MRSLQRKRRKKVKNLSLPSEDKISYLATKLTQQIDKETFRKKYAPVTEVIKLVGAGAFLATSLVFPTLPQVIKPFLSDPSAYEAWKRFNIPYLKRTLRRLEKEKLIEIDEAEGMQIVKITNHGRRRILKCALDELAIEKPKVWDGTWRLVSYDFPRDIGKIRDIFRDYLKAWGFYPLHKSVFLHAYPCGKEVEFLREYLGIGEYVRIFKVTAIENDKVFKVFFGV